jgi:hypothetical protein
MIQSFYHQTIHHVTCGDVIFNPESPELCRGISREDHQYIGTSILRYGGFLHTAERTKHRVCCTRACQIYNKNNNKRGRIVESHQVLNCLYHHEKWLHDKTVLFSIFTGSQYVDDSVFFFSFSNSCLSSYSELNKQKHLQPADLHNITSVYCDFVICTVWIGLYSGILYFKPNVSRTRGVVNQPIICYWTENSTNKLFLCWKINWSVNIQLVICQRVQFN